MRLVLMGAPGAGKGTQAAILSKRLGIPAISTGQILREAVQAGSPLGMEAKKHTDLGRLVPDDIIIGVITDRLKMPDCAGGFILDGVPRTIEQAEALDKMGVSLDRVISYEIPDEDIIKRMSGRRVCPCGETFHAESNPPKKEGVCDKCGCSLLVREDDRPETVRERIKVYHKQTEPLEAYYRAKGLLTSVDARQSIEEAATAALDDLGV